MCFLLKEPTYPFKSKAPCSLNQDDLVFEITKALWENKDKISLTINDFSTLEPENALDNDSPMHPGAIKFWSSPYATHSASR